MLNVTAGLLVHSHIGIHYGASHSVVRVGAPTSAWATRVPGPRGPGPSGTTLSSEGRPRSSWGHPRHKRAPICKSSYQILIWPCRFCARTRNLRYPAHRGMFFNNGPKASEALGFPPDSQDLHQIPYACIGLSRLASDALGLHQIP